MRRILFAIISLSCVLIFAPSAPAMQSTSPQAQEVIDYNNHIVIENLCDPGFSEQFSEESMFLALDYEQMEKVRIELLERGYNPGFDLERSSASDAQLMEALAQFQSEYDLPVTGHVDAATLAGLSLPIQKSDSKIEDATQRAKPSK